MPPIRGQGGPQVAHKLEDIFRNRAGVVRPPSGPIRLSKIWQWGQLFSRMKYSNSFSDEALEEELGWVPVQPMIYFWLYRTPE